MAQVWYPAIDEFRGMYNGRSVFEDSEGSEESGATAEILFNSENAKVPATMEEIASVGEAVSGFEQEVVAEFRAAGNPLIGYEEGSYLVPGDRTIQLLPGHYSLVNPDYCGRLAKLLCDRFPLWRVIIASPGTEDVPIVYPEKVVIPKSWQGHDEAYWSALLQVGQRAYESDYARLVDLKVRLIQDQIRKRKLEVTTSHGIQCDVLGIFEENRVVNRVPSVLLDIWVRTDNSYPGLCYLSQFRAVGIWGSESKYGIDKAGEMKPHRFGVFTEDDRSFWQRIYVISIQDGSFKGFIHLRSPETSEDFEVRVPKDVPRWRQVGESMKLEKVEL